MRVSTLLGLSLAAAIATPLPAAADHGPPPEPPPPAQKITTQLPRHERPLGARFGVGIALGGPPLLQGTSNHTTALFTMMASVQLRLSRISPRTLELSGIAGHGFGLTLKNDDLRVGRLRLHLLDVGLFYALGRSVSVQRVERTWDITAGMSGEVLLKNGMAITADARLFSPLDIFHVVTSYGDSSRLIGEEILKGVQLWFGTGYRW